MSMTKKKNLEEVQQKRSAGQQRRRKREELARRQKEEKQKQPQTPQSEPETRTQPQTPQRRAVWTCAVCGVLEENTTDYVNFRVECEKCALARFSFRMAEMRRRSNGNSRSC